MIFIYIALSSALLYILTLFFWKLYQIYNIPGPSGISCLSYTKKLLFMSTSDFVPFLSELSKAYGEFYKAWLGPHLFIVARKPEHLKIILNHPDCLDKGQDYRFMRNILGDGLLTAPVDIWRLHRKLVSPAMNKNFFSKHLSSVNVAAKHLAQNLKKESAQQDILHYVTECIEDIFFDTMVGPPSLTSTDKKYLHNAVKTLEDIVVKRIITLWLQLDIVFRFSKYSKVVDEIVSKSKNILTKVLDEKIFSVKNEMESESEDGKRYFLTHLVKHHLDGNLSQEDLLGELKIFIPAILDTTAFTMCAIMALLGMNQDIQNKLYKEVIDVIGDQIITLEDIPKLKYLDCVIKETLRITPPLTILSRRTASNIDLGEFTIPKDSDILIQIFDLHREEKYWPDPLKFDPDRFAPENASKIYPGSFLPFSAGPRNCIGQHVGMFMIKVLLAEIVRSFKISTRYKSVEEIEFYFAVIVRPKEGFKISLEERL